MELLLTMTILGIILGLANTFLLQGVTIQRSTEQRSAEQEMLDSVSQLLISDIRLAGYQGSGLQPLTLSEAVQVGNNSVTVTYLGTRAYERLDGVETAWEVTYRVTEAGILERCQQASGLPNACIDVATGFSALTVEFSPVRVALRLNRIDADMPPLTVRVALPRSLPTTASSGAS